MKKHILLCVDRDGTIIYDDNYHLGKDNYWRDKIRFLPKIAEGMKLLDKHFPNQACRFIITNQPGVAIADFKRLTMKRAQEVTKEIQHLLKREGAFFDGYIVCGHVSPEYVENHKQYKFERKYVQPECNCFKPNIGMIQEAMGKKGLDPEKTNLYIIGDRESDILTALNASGVGILVPFENRTEDTKKVEKLQKKHPGKVFIVKDFLEAIELIVKREE